MGSPLCSYCRSSTRKCNFDLNPSHNYAKQFSILLPRHCLQGLDAKLEELCRPRAETADDDRIITTNQRKFPILRGSIVLPWVDISSHKHATRPGAKAG